MSGLWRNAAHEYFVSALLDDDHLVEVGPLRSVTTFLKALANPAFIGWATRETAAAAIRNLPTLAAMVAESGPAAAQKWLQTKPGYIKDNAADLGTRAHMLAEAVARGEEIGEEDQANPKIRQYLRFLEEWQPRFVGIEQMVVNFTEGYAGTADLWAWLDGELWLLDIKTGKGTYPDMALQLAGLHHGEWWGWPDRPDLMIAPKATRFGILHLQDDKYDLLEYNVTEEDYSAFLAIKRTFEWTEGRAKSVVLGPVKREVAT
jgi:hypothetical protein